jgi:hypothetical protein
MTHFLNQNKLGHQIFAAVGLVAVLSLSELPPAPAAEDNLIIPGQRIGQTHLSSNGGADLKKLPQPAAFDAAMQKTQSVWVAKTSGQQKDTLYISTLANAAANVPSIHDFTITHIEVTSAQFHTPNGISTGSTRAQILRQFPNARPDSYNNGKTLSDEASGIAFEFANSDADAPCISIAVASPGDNVGIVGRNQVNTALFSLIKDSSNSEQTSSAEGWD